jgi:Spy/CpxP family protein refolding chaperone
MRLRNLSAACAATLLLATMGLTVRAQGAGGGQGFGGGQGGGQRRGGRGNNLAQVPVSVLGYELKLTADQKTKIQAIQDTLADTIKKAQAPAAGGQPDFQALRASYTQANTDITAVLTDDQKAKLPDMFKALAPYNTVGIPLGVLPSLKLTEDQKTKIAAIADDASTKTRDAFQNAQGGDRQAAMTAIQAIRKDAGDKAVALLTESQKTTLEAYKKAHPQPQGFGGFGRPGGQPRQGA